MKERLIRQLKPEVREGLRLAQQLAGKEPVIRKVPPLPGEVRARMLRPTLPNRPYEIEVVQGQDRTTEHLVLHEIGHIVRLHRVPGEERLAPIITPESRRRAAEDVFPYLGELVNRGLSEEAIVELFGTWHENLMGQLANFPADMRIEDWVHNRFPGVRPIQRRSLTEEVHRGYPGFHPTVQRYTPPVFYHPIMAMNAAEALHTAELLRSPVLFEPYEQHGYGDVARRLVGLALNPEDHGHASDMVATNAWAQELGLGGWYEWQEYRESR